MTANFCLNNNGYMIWQRVNKVLESFSGEFQTDMTTPDQSGPRSNSNEEVSHLPPKLYDFE